MKTTRRQFLSFATTVSAFATSATWLTKNAAAQPGRPNIVFILADDLGWADTAPYGAELHETPNIARLAKQGVRFTNAYSAAPVCSPTRASLMTGKYPARLQMTVWSESAGNPPRNRALLPPITRSSLPLEEITLAESLREQGYLTAHVGKWHLGTADHYPENQGFDVNIGGSHWGAPQTFFYPYRGNKHYGGEPRYVPHTEFGKPGEYLTDRLTDEALKVIDRAGSQPYFLNLWYHSVHTPIEGKPADVERYRRALKPEFHHQNPDYAAMVHSLDENIGRILNRIDSNTIVIFASDNGGLVGNYAGKQVTNNHPLRSGKGSLYEGGIRIPLIASGPGIAKDKTCQELVITNDLFPTVLALSGSKGHGEHDGVNLKPLLENPHLTLERKELFFHYPHYYATTTPVSAVRSGDWKLIEYLEDDRVELYHLASDPSEAKDVAGEHPDKASELKARLHAWRLAMNAQMPTRQRQPA